MAKVRDTARPPPSPWASLGMAQPSTQEMLDAAAMAMMMMPVAGDVAGLASDAYRFATDPESRTLGNAAWASLGMLPFVPALSTMKALDMSQEARMARAAEQGFDTSRPVYHGSQSDFSAFSDDAFGTGKTGAITKRQMPRGHYFTPQHGYASVFGDPKEYFLNLKNPKVYDYSDFNAGYAWDTPHGKEVAKIADETGLSWREAMDELNARLRAQGHDAIVFKQRREGIPNPGDRVDEIVVFDPKNIRSVHAAFDPAKRNSGDLLASLAGAGLLGATAARLYGDDEQ